jgi:hypothetical protein
MTEGIKSHGTILAIGDGVSPESFSTITERFSIPEIGGRKELIDFSNHDSVDFREYKVADLADGNELTVECNEIPGDTEQDLVRTAHTDSTTDNWKVEYTDGSYEIFPAIVLAVGTDPSELDGRVVFRFTLKIAGAIERTTV